jgi:hypothetical protein
MLPFDPILQVENVVHLPNVSPRVFAVSQLCPCGQPIGHQPTDDVVNLPVFRYLYNRAARPSDL